MPKSSCLIGLLWSGQSFGESTILDFKSPLNCQVKEKKFIQIGPETTKLDCYGQDSHLGKVQYRILNPHQISKSKKIFFIQTALKTTKLKT